MRLVRCGDHAEADRLLCELTGVEVECDDCGRKSFLGFTELQAATFAGVFSYSRLVERLRCRECPPMPRKWRRLSVCPHWRGSGAQTVA
jgi:hypothetical protein